MLNQAQFKAAGASYAPTPGSLTGDSVMQNQQAREASLTPGSVLSEYMHIRSVYNGNSAADAARQTPNGQLPTANGMSQSTYQARYPSTYGYKMPVAA